MLARTRWLWVLKKFQVRLFLEGQCVQGCSSGVSLSRHMLSRCMPCSIILLISIMAIFMSIFLLELLPLMAAECCIRYSWSPGQEHQELCASVHCAAQYGIISIRTPRLRQCPQQLASHAEGCFACLEANAWRMPDIIFDCLVFVVFEVPCCMLSGLGNECTLLPCDSDPGYVWPCRIRRGCGR